MPVHLTFIGEFFAAFNAVKISLVFKFFMFMKTLNGFSLKWTYHTGIFFWMKQTRVPVDQVFCSRILEKFLFDDLSLFDVCVFYVKSSYTFVKTIFDKIHRYILEAFSIFK